MAEASVTNGLPGQGQRLRPFCGPNPPSRATCFYPLGQRRPFAPAARFGLAKSPTPNLKRRRLAPPTMLPKVDFDNPYAVAEFVLARFGELFPSSSPALLKQLF